MTGKTRLGYLSHFLLGVADENHIDEEGRPKQFMAFVKVGTGYDLAELKNINERLKPAHIECNKGDTMPHLNMWRAQKKDDIPDVYFTPSKSLVMEVQAAQVVPTDQFNAQMTLRFPRVVKMRYDKVCVK